MDIKDWILIGGGLLLLAVVAHGFWLGLRNRRGALLMDIDHSVPREEVDDLDLLRSELPNGGARIRSKMDLVLNRSRSTQDKKDPGEILVAGHNQAKSGEEKSAHDSAGIIVEERQNDVQKARYEGEQGSLDLGEAEQAAAIVAEPRVEPNSESMFNTRKASDADTTEVTTRDVEELIIINVFGLTHSVFEGSDLVEVFLRNTMKYGFMSIFHRQDAMTKAVQFSVASAVEPGCFDLSDIDNYQTPGVSFFLQLPGPANAMESFEDMLFVAQDLAENLGGDLRDESMSVMTGQTIEHYRQRISEFARKQLSQQA
ncbi:MAG: cell division protein ZipA [Pseudomonadales bacterium]|nr:cell division protein ZipA [Pseudomonadales bacterium]